ncbi:MAG: 16S rRNA (adenine(1518)-N(6)/adenine(1519)-N(6))-dimethyltransferase RsmA [Peptococcaceae bacterium]|nr:16S rRNA (adenine(1518)-N(6)/adenine(1519)-N(6))-dimethyltransferase RsmA [Peptococcaceae bacterium]
MESALIYTKRALNSNGLRAKKSLGQNFLVDDGIIQRIIDDSGVRPGDAVLEIGPGIGVLTRALARMDTQLWAVELDDSLFRFLQQQFESNAKVTIMHGDALKLSLETVDLPVEKVKVIANLPYYITSPLIKHFLAQRQYLDSLTLMVQHEVAKRIVAAPGTKDFGILSVAVQAFCDAQYLFTVPPTAFLPAPKVHSAVIKLKVLEHPRVIREEEFFATVKAAFAQRRKTMLNALSKGFGCDKQVVSETMQSIGLDPNCRAETLSVTDFVHLAESLARNLKLRAITGPDAV